MRIVLHIGPHKTGTTSLQLFLKQNFSEMGETQYWYPPTKTYGPGHAELAWETLGVPPARKNLSYLSNVIEAASQGGVGTLLLSSEEFSRATDAQLGDLGEALRGMDVCLIITLSEIERRCASLWQENVKHGDEQRIDDSRDKILSNSGIQPNLIRRFVDNISPQACAVVVVDTTASGNEIFANFYRAMSDFVCRDERIESLFRQARVVSNRSLGLHEALCLLEMNKRFREAQLDRPKYFAARNALMAQFDRKEWRLMFPWTPIRLPMEWGDAISNLESALHAELTNLSAAGRVRIYGDVDKLKSARRFNDFNETIEVADEGPQRHLDSVIAHAFKNAADAKA